MHGGPSVINESFLPPERIEHVEIAAAKNVELFLTGDMSQSDSDQRYEAIGRRAAVLADGPVAGTVISRGSEIARTLFRVPFTFDPMEGRSLFHDDLAEAAIEAVNPAALTQLRESLGTDSVGGMIDALVVSESSQGGRQQAVVDYQEGLGVTTHQITTEVDFQNGAVLR